MTMPLTSPGAWWFISREDARRIADALDLIWQQADSEAVRKAAESALRRLNSGLNDTDEVPADWQIEATVPAYPSQTVMNPTAKAGGLSLALHPHQRVHPRR